MVEIMFWCTVYGAFYTEIVRKIFEVQDSCHRDRRTNKENVSKFEVTDASALYLQDICCDSNVSISTRIKEKIKAQIVRINEAFARLCSHSTQSFGSFGRTSIFRATLTV